MKEPLCDKLYVKMLCDRFVCVCVKGVVCVTMLCECDRVVCVCMCKRVVCEGLVCVTGLCERVACNSDYCVWTLCAKEVDKRVVSPSAKAP